MFHKKKFTLVEEQNHKKMYTAKNIKWLKYLIFLALTAFILLMILANVKSKSYYKNLNASKKANEQKNSATRAILSLDGVSSRAISCSTRTCSVTCSGDMTGLNTYLDSQAKSCALFELLSISEGSFPNDRLQSNWLKGSFNLKSIKIAQTTLREIDNGAFNQNTVVSLKQLSLRDVQLASLTENTFVGLNSLEEFTLYNKIEVFSGDAFLKPMLKTLKTVTIGHNTNTPTDPGPWFRGGDFPKLMTITFDHCNFGGYIKAATFEHLQTLAILSLNSCNINYIADGAFDFIMHNVVVYINLKDNNLKRLAGNYLTKVVLLRSVLIANNPWDCTCELNDLIKEYKRDSEGFGENVLCSTPSIHAGKVLSHVDPCNDPPEATTPPTTTTTPTTISTTSSSTELSTSTESPSPPSSVTDSTELATTEPPSTTEESTTTATPESVEPPSTTEESTTSTTDTTYTPNFSTKSTTDWKTTPEDEITTPSHPTTPSPQNRTTTISADETISIQCDRYITDSSITSRQLYIELLWPDTYFYIYSVSETSVVLRIKDPIADLAVIWFFEQPVINGSGENFQIVEWFKVGCQSDLDDSLLIEGLAKSQAYTFCLVKEGAQSISPFNCLSHYTNDNSEERMDVSEAWLRLEDKALTIGLFVLGIIISLCMGALGMFLVLRASPTLLKGSKRVIVVNRSTGDVLIMPRPGGKSSTAESSYRDSYETNTTIRQRRFSDTSIQSGRSYMMANNYEDIEYRWKMNVVNDLIYANRVPKSSPPPLPKRISQDTSLTKNNMDKMKVAVVCQKGNDYGYIA